MKLYLPDYFERIWIRLVYDSLIIRKCIVIVRDRKYHYLFEGDTNRLWATGWLLYFWESFEIENWNCSLLIFDVISNCKEIRTFIRLIANVLCVKIPYVLLHFENFYYLENYRIFKRKKKEKTFRQCWAFWKIDALQLRMVLFPSFVQRWRTVIQCMPLLAINDAARKKRSHCWCG